MSRENEGEWTAPSQPWAEGWESAFNDNQCPYSPGTISEGKWTSGISEGRWERDKLRDRFKRINVAGDEMKQLRDTTRLSVEAMKEQAAELEKARERADAWKRTAHEIFEDFWRVVKDMEKVLVRKEDES